MEPTREWMERWACLLKQMEELVRDAAADSAQGSAKPRCRLITQMKQAICLMPEMLKMREERQNPKRRFVPLRKLNDEEDVGEFLHFAERMMVCCEVQPEQWAASIAPYLTGVAKEAYRALGDKEREDYEVLRHAILRRYNCTNGIYPCILKETREQKAARDAPWEALWERAEKEAVALVAAAKEAAAEEAAEREARAAKEAAANEAKAAATTAPSFSDAGAAADDAGASAGDAGASEAGSATSGAGAAASEASASAGDAGASEAGSATSDAGAAAGDAGAGDGGAGDGGAGDGGAGDGGAAAGDAGAGEARAAAGEAGADACEAGAAAEAGAASASGAAADGGASASDAGASASDAGASASDAGASASDAGAAASEAGAASETGATASEAGALIEMDQEMLLADATKPFMMVATSMMNKVSEAVPTTRAVASEVARLHEKPCHWVIKRPALGQLRQPAVT